MLEAFALFISIQELELRRIEFDQEFKPDLFDVGPDLELAETVRAAGHAELLEEHHGKGHKVQDIRLVGSFSTRIQVKCARCLDPVERSVGGTFDLIYRPIGEGAQGPVVAISEADTEIGFYTGEGLLLEDALTEQVLLAAPIKAVCREDCKGLCPGCGNDLNKESCTCGAPSPDPRWAALADIKEKLK